MKTLNVLLADTGREAAALLRNELGVAYKPAIRQVGDAASFAAALGEQSWDVVISDYSMGDLGAADALRLLRGFDPEVPFIVLSGKGGDDLAEGAARAGMRTDSAGRNLLRLLPTLERELREAAARREAHTAQKRQLEQQALRETLVRHFPGVVVRLVSTADRAYTFSLVSDGSFELLELSPEALRADSDAFFRLLQQSDARALSTQMKKSGATLRPVNWEGRLRTARTGTTKWVNVRLTPCCGSAGEIVWEGFMANISRSKEHEQEIVRSRRRLSELSSHLEKAKERERERIARELHDHIGGNLSAIKIALARLAGGLPQDNAKGREHIDSLEAMIDETAAAVVRIGQDLRPGILDLGLVAAIEWQALEFSNRMGVPCALNLSPAPLGLDNDAQTTLFSIFREMLTNVAKHSRATEVSVTLERSKAGVELAVADNGVGLDAADRLKPASFGLRGMEERATQLGGTLSVFAREPRGTCVSVKVPLASTSRRAKRGVGTKTA